MNVHAPERQPNESQDAYRARRAKSAAITRDLRLIGLGGKLTSRELLRDEQRKNSNLRGIYGQGLRNQFNRKRAQQQAALPHLRDQHGAYTRVGFDYTVNSFQPVRRVWLAGISARRGY